MYQERRNNLMILQVHRDLTDMLDSDIEAVAQDFVSLNDFRRNLFGFVNNSNLTFFSLLSPRVMSKRNVTCV
jgi:hypothetical protein